MTPKYVVTRTTAEKMKALGFPQKTDFCWINYANGITPIKCEWRLVAKENATPLQHKALFTSNDFNTDWCENIAAPHVAELGDWLPYKAFGDYLCEYKGVDDWTIGYGVQKTFYGKTHVEARAAMLIFLAEQGLIQPSNL